MPNTPITVFSVIHGPHGDTDRLTATLQANVFHVPTAPFGIIGWRLTIDVVHTPEPTTILLFCTGLAGVAIKMRKRLKSRKSG